MTRLFGRIWYNVRHLSADSESRAELNKMYPDEPTTANGLEEMQASLLLRQEESLRRLREQSKGFFCSIFVTSDSKSVT